MRKHDYIVLALAAAILATIIAISPNVQTVANEGSTEIYGVDILGLTKNARDLLGAEAVRLRIGIRIKRRAAVAAIAGPEAEARAFVAVGFPHHPGRDVRRLAALKRRCGAPGEACHREIERAPEEMHRAHLA